MLYGDLHSLGPTYCLFFAFMPSKCSVPNYSALFLLTAHPPGLCSWVVNIIGFYNVYCDVEPKRRALEAANADLAAAEEKLSKITSKIKV